MHVILAPIHFKRLIEMNKVVIEAHRQAGRNDS